MPKIERCYFLPKTAEELDEFNKRPTEWAKTQLVNAAAAEAEPLLKSVSRLLGLEKFDYDSVKREHLFMLLFSALYKLQEETIINQAMVEELYDDQLEAIENNNDHKRIDDLIAELAKLSRAYMK